MQANVIACNGQPAVALEPRRQHRCATYQKVCDARKHPVRGLWVRNGRYYAQVAIEDPNTGLKRMKRVPIEGATTDPQAIAKFHELLTNRRKKTLPVLKRTPKFSDYAETYFGYCQDAKDAKRESTLKTERVAINHWNEHLGHVRLNHITRALVNSYIAKRQAAGVSGRTVNLEMVAFRNIMNRGIDDGWIVCLPTTHIRPLKWTPRKRGLLSASDIVELCAAAMKVRMVLSVPSEPIAMTAYKNGQQFSDYIRLMAFCGSRRNETLRLKWSDVDWDRRQLTIGSDGLTKNHRHRVVDFDSKLEGHLKDMFKRRAPDSAWLFPSPQRGQKDEPAKSFVETMRMVRNDAKLPRFGFHDLRHYFISYCVMSGIDYMTIARWVGHQDGGVLIGKVYGHLSNEHAQLQATRLNFGPIVVNQASV